MILISPRALHKWKYYSTLNEKRLVALLYTQVIFSNIAYFVTNVCCCNKVKWKQYHAAILVSCTPQCIRTEQTTKAKWTLVKYRQDNVLQLICSCSISFENVSGTVVWFWVRTETIGRTSEPFHRQLQGWGCLLNVGSQFWVPTKEKRRGRWVWTSSKYMRSLSLCLWNSLF